MKYEVLDNKSALHHLKRGRLPYQYEVNPYRGCEHGCKYCFAIYSQDYLNDHNDYFETVYYKKNVIEKLEKELSSPKWKKEVICFGGIADCYQPLEAKLGLMREMLKLMIKYRNPVIISTKSILILRDMDLLEELSKVAVVNIAFTITTVDEKVRRLIEPCASSSKSRFLALKELRKTNAVLGVHIMPIIPYLTAGKQNLETIYRLSSKIGVDYVLPGVLYLRGKTKNYFYHSIEEWNPEMYLKIKQMYSKGKADNQFKKNLYDYIHDLERKYAINSNYAEKIKAKENSLMTNQENKLNL